MQKILNSAIIGAGSIGGLIDSKNSPIVASHAHAYYKNSGIKLEAICEPDKKNIKDFQNLWGRVNVYEDANTMLEDESIDILSICSPTHLHKEHLSLALKHNVKYILCEKPFASSLVQLEELEQKLGQKKVLINIIRSYNPYFSILKKYNLGKPLSFYAICNKGILHNGIHILDSIEILLQPIKTIIPLCVEKTENDLMGKFKIILDSANGIIDIIDSKYSIFKIDIKFENGSIEIGGDKINIFNIKKSNFKGYQILFLKDSYSNIYKNYMIDSLNFLLNTDNQKLQTTLKRHINLHKKIFKVLI